MNLCLDVTGVRDGMHELDGIYTVVDFLFDEIAAERSDDVVVAYTDGRRYEQDAALRAAKAMKDAYGVGAKITIRKRIPEGAGLGGSSVDAAAVIRAMEALYGLPKPKADFLLALGSDVPFCYAGGTQRVSGIGETLAPVRLAKVYAVIVVPDSGVSTRACYALYDEIGGEHGNVAAFVARAATGDYAPFNALRAAAERLNPDVKKGVALLERAGFIAGMSGSGSATFGLETSKEKYDEKLKILKTYAEGYAVYAEEGETR